MKKLLLLGNLLLLLFGFLWSSPINAATDQHCLKPCVDAGNASVACLPECTYASPSDLKALQPSIPGEQHKMFTSIKPLEGIALSSSKPKPVPASKDYVCLNDCLASGWQYGLCTKTCTKALCKPGAVLCENLRGSLAANPGFTGTSSPTLPRTSEMLLVRPGVVGN